MPTTQCTATSKRTGVQCGQMVVGNGTVCKWHGGHSPRARQAQAAKDLADQARKLIPDLDELDPITDPLSRLLELATEADAFRESMKVLTNNLADRIRFTDEKGAEQLRSEIAVYRSAVRDVTDLLVAIAKLNIEDRLARIQGQRLTAMLAFVDAVVHDLGHEPRSTKVREVYERHLRAV